ncbi:MAG TPA: response regulator [Allosphingosinicella sp.]|jgi:CheY-like chemotaxis protein
MTLRAQNAAVLVVEDEALIRSVAAESLLDAGITSYEAADSEEALEVLEQHPDIGIVFTDVNMPGRMDGLHLAGRVHELRPDVELIVTSGREAVTDRDLPDHGTFLPKPYRLRELIELVGTKIREGSRKRRHALSRAH